jgi:hypothetical protein
MRLYGCLTVSLENHGALRDFRPHVYFSGDKTYQVTFVTLSAERKRNSGYIRADLIADIVSKHTQKEVDGKCRWGRDSVALWKLTCSKWSKVQVYLLVENEKQISPAALAVAKGFPLYSRKKAFNKQAVRVVYVDFLISKDLLSKVDYSELQNAAVGCRLMSSWFL